MSGMNFCFGKIGIRPVYNRQNNAYTLIVRII